MRGATAVAVIATVAAMATPSAGAALPGKVSMVGHDSLLARGLNSNLALSGGFAYVGSYSDTAGPAGGIVVVDVRRPSRPRVRRRMSSPLAGPPGSSPIELRVWHRRDVLMAFTDRCRQPSCPTLGTARPAMRFYDVRGRRAARPRLLDVWHPNAEPHEFFLWQDPRRPSRALVFLSTPSPQGTNVVVADISRVRSGVVREVARWKLPAAGLSPAPFGVHSLSVSPNGRRAYVAAYNLGFFMLDTSDLAEGRPRPRIRLLTPLARGATWPGTNAHSVVPLVGRPFALVADEIYGCPWGWARIVDVRRPRRPRVVAEARVPPFNDPLGCSAFPPVAAGYSAHNPTIVGDVALVSWYGSGLQTWSLANPRRPRRLAAFLPRPLPAVRAEHPALSGGPVKVVTTSHPVVHNGLVYVVDMRNGLYVLRYRGPLAKAVRHARFVEGNSNLTRAR